jgi:hypothetical protein
MSTRIKTTPLPDNSLLQRFIDSGDYTDCYVTHVGDVVEFPDFVEAFYTTSVFKVERFILKLVGYPSTDESARELADGVVNEFAAWRVLDRAENQLLLMDVRGQTCSWFRLEPESDGTQLHFGSAVIRSKKSSSGRRMGWTYRALLGFHRLYSRILLRAARDRLSATRQT